MGLSATYTIEVGGHLEPRYTSWFEGMTITPSFVGEEPITILSGSLLDQAALYGVLGKLQAMNIPLLALNRLKDV